MEHAHRAATLTQYKSPAVLDTLATAYAAAGQFDQATATATKALQLVENRGSPVEPEIRARLDMFRNHQPYRAPAPVATTPATNND